MEDEVQALLADIEGNGDAYHLDDYLHHRQPGSSRQTTTPNVRSQSAFGNIPAYLGPSAYGQVAQAQSLYPPENNSRYTAPANAYREILSSL